MSARTGNTDKIRAVLEQAPATRNELAERTGLRPLVVGGLLQALNDTGQIRAIGKRAQPGKRWAWVWELTGFRPARSPKPSATKAPTTRQPVRLVTSAQQQAGVRAQLEVAPRAPGEPETVDEWMARTGQRPEQLPGPTFAPRCGSAPAHRGLR